jgi:multidrug efflux pump
MARELRQVPDVKKIELIGVQDEKIYVEVSHAKLATLGIDPLAIFDALQKQNAMAPAGFFETAVDRVRFASRRIRFGRERREIGIQAGGRSSGSATSPPSRAASPIRRRRACASRAAAIGIAVAMNKGGDVIKPRRPPARREFSACSRICRWASTCTSSPTSRRSSASRSTSSCPR